MGVLLLLSREGLLRSGGGVPFSSPSGTGGGGTGLERSISGSGSELTFSSGTSPTASAHASTPLEVVNCSTLGLHMHAGREQVSA